VSLSYVEVTGRLEAIEDDLAKRQDEWEKAVDDFARVTGEWKLRYARTYLQTEGTVKEREQQTVVTIAAAPDDLYDRYTDAEARVATRRSVYEVLDKRASVNQSLLKAMTREAPQTGVQPGWTKVAA